MFSHFGQNVADKFLVTFRCRSMPKKKNWRVKRSFLSSSGNSMQMTILKCIHVLISMSSSLQMCNKLCSNDERVENIVSSVARRVHASPETENRFRVRQTDFKWEFLLFGATPKIYLHFRLTLHLIDLLIRSRFDAIFSVCLKLFFFDISLVELQVIDANRLLFLFQLFGLLVGRMRKAEAKNSFVSFERSVGRKLICLWCD